VKAPDKLLRHLERRDVGELALISGRLPCVKVGVAFDPVDEEAPTADEILALLMTVGGSRYVDMLGPVPKQWTSRVAGVGIIAISAVVPRDGEVQARFSVAARDERVRTAAPPRRSDRPQARKSKPPLRDAGGRSSPRPPGPPNEAAPPPSLRPSRTPSFGIPLKHDSLPPPAPMSAVDKSAIEKSAIDKPGIDKPLHHSRGPAPVWEFPKRRPSSDGLKRPSEVETRPEVRPSPPPRRTSPWEQQSPINRAVAEAARAGRPATKPMGDVARPAEPETKRLEGLRVLEPLLKSARSQQATDLHVVSGRPPVLRVAGDLKASGDVLSAEAVERMLVGCIPDRLSFAFQELGSCDFSLDLGPTGRFRVNVSRQQTGLKGTIRLVPRDVPTLELLGMPPAIAAATKHHQGLIVVTGPTGHGKTSTLAAIVDILNQETRAHIITVEDPIEYVHPKKKALISQREVGTHTRSFASALAGSLREDPDVIVVGELRDTETVRMAVSASETGHLVIGTMNTPSAAKTIDRLIDLFPPADQPQVRTALASGLRLIVGQRLLPAADKSRMYVAAELLPGSVALSALIREGKTFQIPSLQQRSKALGIIRLDESLAALVHARMISPEVAKAAAESPAELDTLVAARAKKG
jgi:twitching motility protein PilT